MKIEKAILKTLIDDCANIASRDSMLTGYVRGICNGKTVRFQSFNNIAVESFAEVDACEKFEFFIPAQKLARAVALFDKTVEMTVSDALYLSEGTFKQKLSLVTLSDNSIWSFPEGQTSTVEIHETAKKVLFDNIDAFPDPKQEGTVKGSVNMRYAAGALETTAANGYIVSNRKYALDGLSDFSITLPIPTAAIIRKQSGAFRFAVISANDAPHLAYFEFAHVRYYSPLVAIKYPEVYKMIIAPKSQPAFKAVAGDFVSAIARFKNFRFVRLAWDDCKLKLSAQNESEDCEYTLEVDETFQAGAAGYNCSFLLKAAAGAAEDSLIEFSHRPADVKLLLLKFSNTENAVAGIKD